MKKLYFLMLLFCGFVNAQIVTIPDANFRAKLIQLGVDTNGDSLIQLTEALNVTALNIGQSNISTLTGIESFQNLTSLDCGINNLSVLNVNNLTNLQTLICSYNYLSNIDVSNLTNLQILYCQYNNLSVLNISTLINLTGLLCTYNHLTVLDVSNSHNLDHLACGSNLLTYLDISNNPLICTLSCASMTTLNRLNLKNASTICLNDKILYGNPNLRFVCVDNDAEAFYMQNYFQNNNMPNVNINTYCSFVPGGDYNTINGTLTFDANNNGCDDLDIAVPNIRININDGNNSGATYTIPTGNYSFFTQAGSFAITPDIENPNWFNFSPPNATIPFASNTNNTATQNFCVTANGIHSDVEVLIVPIIPARPGFNAVYQVVCKNKGNQTLFGNVSFNYNDAVLDFISSTVAPNSQTTGLLTFDYTNLLPFESRSFYITLNVNGPMETPAVNIGDQLDFTAIVNPVAGDENPSDNTFAFKQIVVGSFDPNDITCLEGNVVSPTEIGKYLHYVINFENTGTAAAENIVVKDIIDTAKFDVSSLQVLTSSDPITTRLTGNIAEFIFQNINLAPSAHGNIVFKIKSKNSLVQGDSVSKRADIFFDYNFPIDTGFATTTFQALNNPGFNLDNSINVYPNPTKGNVSINCNSNIKLVQVYDVQGRLLQTKTPDENNVVIDLGLHQKGVYFVKVSSDKGIKVEKIIKE